MPKQILTLLLILLASSCQRQKIMKSIPEAENLVINQHKFIGKPLRILLVEIKPDIKFVYGEPENTSGRTLGETYLVFTFVDKEAGKKRLNGETRTRITVQFQLEPKNTRKPLPKEGLAKWTKIETKEYGDMIVLSIRVSGKN